MTSRPTTHVIGGGLAGLSAALTLAERDPSRAITVHESGPACGGRCRSYEDQALGARIDNGNHLLLSGNHAAMAYLDRLGTRGTLAGPGEPIIPFMDLRSGRRWTLRMNRGRLPWWLLLPGRRVPGTRVADYLPLLKLVEARPGTTVMAALPDNALYRKLVEPFAVAVLNTPAHQGSARQLGVVIDETLSRGGAACVPLFPAEGLSESFITPAVARLTAAGHAVRTAHRIATLRFEGNRVAGLGGPAGEIALGPGDSVVVATPPTVAADLLPGLEAPTEFQAIVNAHFKIAAPFGEAGILGLIGGLTEWIFIKPGIVSITISAANRLIDKPAEELAVTIWSEVQRALNLAEPLPAWRVVKEKRATFAATPAQLQRRPGATTAWENCVLAGDYTATNLPATIEGAIRSGLCAAEVLLRKPA